MGAGSSKSAFFDKTYDEVLALTEEAYAYLSEIESNKIKAATPDEDLRLRGEAFRLTTRLMQVVSWLMTQRAIQAGELSAAEFADDMQYRLGAAKVCRDVSQHHHPTIPPKLSDMLERSHNLYTRIERLDEMMQGNIH